MEERSLYRLMRALASAGIFQENDKKTFSLTPAGKSLQKEGIQAIARMFLSAWHNRAWDYLIDSLKTGTPAFERAFGIPAFQWLENNPQEGAIYHEANRKKSAITAAAILDVYDFTPFELIIDIGGGYGGLLFRILQSVPQAKGVITDLPYIRQEVDSLIIQHNLSGRCRFLPSDFFQEVPENGDCYILSKILHDWNDKECGTILNNCFRWMGDNGTLLIIESIVDSGNGFSPAAFLDLEMMVMGSGRERTEDEFRELVGGSGFMMEEVIQAGESLSLMRCRKRA